MPLRTPPVKKTESKGLGYVGTMDQSVESIPDFKKSIKNGLLVC